MEKPDCDVVALCDVYEPYVTRDRSRVDPRYIENTPKQVPVMGEKFQHEVEKYRDYRKLLENKHIDADILIKEQNFNNYTNDCINYFNLLFLLNGYNSQADNPGGSGGKAAINSIKKNRHTFNKSGMKW
jgi:hypothetical protein